VKKPQSLKIVGVFNIINGTVFSFFSLLFVQTALDNDNPSAEIIVGIIGATGAVLLIMGILLLCRLGKAAQVGLMLLSYAIDLVIFLIGAIQWSSTFFLFGPFFAPPVIAGTVYFAKRRRQETAIAPPIPAAPPAQLSETSDSDEKETARVYNIGLKYLAEKELALALQTFEKTVGYKNSDSLILAIRQELLGHRGGQSEKRYDDSD
jgi:multisubunit Na+/H+ antiporter MnhC subunit